MSNVLARPFESQREEGLPTEGWLSSWRRRSCLSFLFFSAVSEAPCSCNLASVLAAAESLAFCHRYSCTLQFVHVVQHSKTGWGTLQEGSFCVPVFSPKLVMIMTKMSKSTNILWDCVSVFITCWCMCVGCTCTHVYMHVEVTQRTSSRAVHQAAPTTFLKQGLSLAWSLPSRLCAQWNPRSESLHLPRAGSTHTTLFCHTCSTYQIQALYWMNWPPVPWCKFYIFPCLV